VFALALILADTLVCPYDFTLILPWNDWGEGRMQCAPTLLVDDLLLLFSGFEYDIGFGLPLQPLVERGEFVRLDGYR